jgi:uncharacterized protein YdiU (UPF0061 family)
MQDLGQVGLGLSCVPAHEATYPQVFLDRHGRKYATRLGDERSAVFGNDLRTRASNVYAVEYDGAGPRFYSAGNRGKGRRFAGSIRP